MIIILFEVFGSDPFYKLRYGRTQILNLVDHYLIWRWVKYAQRHIYTVTFFEEGLNMHKGSLLHESKKIPTKGKG